MGVDVCLSALCKQLSKQVCVDAHAMETLKRPRPCSCRFPVTCTPWKSVEDPLPGLEMIAWRRDGGEGAADSCGHVRSVTF